MSITPFLSRAFDPEMTRVMGIAFESACRSLRLIDRSDPAAELVAMKIIEIAQTGERDSDRLCAAVLEIFKPSA